MLIQEHQMMPRAQKHCIIIIIFTALWNMREETKYTRKRSLPQSTETTMGKVEIRNRTSYHRDYDYDKVP